MSLLVLTAAGVKHLRDHDIVHRDIKPGNILRCVAEDGRSLKQVCKYMCLDRENRNGYFSNKFVSTRGGWTGAN